MEKKIKSIIIVFVFYSMLIFVLSNEDYKILSTKTKHHGNINGNGHSDLNEEISNISDYDYPLPEAEESEYYSIALLGTSDIHGTAFQSHQYHPGINENYTVGGLEILATHLRIMKKAWGERMLWLDSGDQFQGGYETKKTDGKIITDFFNSLGLRGSTIGNHEFDFGQEFLGNYLNGGTFDYVISNLELQEAQKGIFKKLIDTKMYKVGNINVGVLALLTLETYKSVAKPEVNLLGIKILEYIDQIKKYSKVLRDNKADVVILVSHIGTICKNTDLDINNIRSYKESVEKECDLPENEMNKLLNQISIEEEKDKIIYLDAVLGGHTHVNTHHFINKKPVVSPRNNGLYYNIVYLKFKKETKMKMKFLEDNEVKYNYEKEKSIIEGPIPVCERVFKNSKLCFGLNDFDKKVGALQKVKFHNEMIVKDETIKVMFDNIYEQIKEDYKFLTKSLVRLEGSRYSQAPGDYQLGNIYTDCIRKSANVDFSIQNSGGFRTSWSPGNITYVDLYNMLPFTTNIIKFKISGRDLIRLMNVVQEGQKGPYQISGFQVVLRNKKVIETRIREGVYIEEDKIYTMTGNQFLINYGDDFSLVKDWFKPIDVEVVGLDRDMLVQCLSEFRVIDINTSMALKRIILVQ